MKNHTKDDQMSFNEVKEDSKEEDDFASEDPDKVDDLWIRDNAVTEQKYEIIINWNC